VGLDQAAQSSQIQPLTIKGGGQCDEAALEGMDHGRAGWEEGPDLGDRARPYSTDADGSTVCLGSNLALGAGGA
jgi:hypothetical protein